MPIVIEYGDNYSKTSGSLWQYYRDEPALNDAGAIDHTSGESASFKFIQKITGKTDADGTKDAEIMVPLKYLSNFWRTLEMPLINCEINFIITWSANCVISNAAANQAITFAITDIKLYVIIISYIIFIIIYHSFINSVINETMINNNKDNITNNDTYLILIIVFVIYCVHSSITLPINLFLQTIFMI